MQIAFRHFILISLFTMAEDRKADNAKAVEALEKELQNLDENAFPQLKTVAENGNFVFTPNHSI